MKHQQNPTHRLASDDSFIKIEIAPEIESLGDEYLPKKSKSNSPHASKKASFTYKVPRDS